MLGQSPARDLRAQFQGAAETGAATGRAFAEICAVINGGSKAMLKVWGKAKLVQCPEGDVAGRGELDLAHQHIDAGGAFGGLDTPEFLAMNPHGLPAIQKACRLGIAQHSALSRRASRWWAFLVRRSARAGACRRLDRLVADVPAADFLGGIFWASIARPKRNGIGSANALARCAAHFGKLERQLDGRTFLLGEAPSLADITAGTSLYSPFELEIARPSLQRWYGSLQQRRPSAPMS